MMLTPSTNKEVDSVMQEEYVIACKYLGFPVFGGSYEFKSAMIKDHHNALLDTPTQDKE